MKQLRLRRPTPSPTHPWHSAAPGLVFRCARGIRRARVRVAAGLFLAFLLGCGLPGSEAQEEPGKPAATPAKAESKYGDFAEVTKGLKKHEGLFTLYETNQTLYAEIKPSDLNQPLIAPIAIARGLALAGQPLNFGDEWILVFRRVGDFVQLLRRNVHYEAPAGTPLQKAVQQNYTDSVIQALPIVSLNPAGGGILLDFSALFLSDFAELGLGAVDRNRCSWHKVKAFPNNVELQAEVTYAGRGSASYAFGDDGVVDGRGITLVIHYSLCKMPDAGYKPRFADHRVGHFLSATKDFGSSDPDTIFVRRVNRWRLEKADPKAKLSPPKRQLVWWVEDTVPHEYRPYVEQGILEWNKAFERIGFRNAIGVRWQNERDDFDPEDINYCTFRWITTSSTFAMSGLRANPVTGEMIDGDVIFDAGWIRALKADYAFLVGKPIGRDPAGWVPLALGEIVSPIMAAKHGFGLPLPLPDRRLPSATELGDPSAMTTQLVPANWSPLQIEMSRRLAHGRFSTCNCARSKQYELGLAAIALASDGKAEPDGRLPEEFLAQTIKEIVMHEVGHSLGLRHNFRASTLLRADQLHDASITRTRGMVGSVMDYNPVNIAGRGQPQGDFAATTLGPYDYWAIEYAYATVEGDETAALKKIAARSPEPELAYATDEDMYLNDDPYVNTYDLGAEPLRFGQDRAALAADLLKTLDVAVVKDGESWNRLRRAFSVLLGQYGNAAHLAAGYVGGQSVCRDFKGEKARDPIVPIAGDKQREALAFLCRDILGSDAFQFPPALLRRLTTENWYHWGSDSFFFAGGIDYPVYDRVLAIQRIALDRCFHPTVLRRIQNQELQSDPGSHPVTIAEIFQTLTDSIWRELKAESLERSGEFSTLRRNLQREHLRRLCQVVLGGRGSAAEDAYGFVFFLGGGGSVPADARSLALAQLGEIAQGIDRTVLQGKVDAVSRAHLSECALRIKKVLEAGYLAGGL